VPLTEPLKLTAVVLVLWHNVWSEMALAVGVGLTVIVNVLEAPAQPLADGVTVIVPEIGDVPVFFAVKAGMLPVLPAPRFMAVLLFVQL
jgi:hypothetical protein